MLPSLPDLPFALCATVGLAPSLCLYPAFIPLPPSSTSVYKHPTHLFKAKFKFTHSEYLMPEPPPSFLNYSLLVFPYDQINFASHPKYALLFSGMQRWIMCCDTVIHELYINSVEQSDEENPWRCRVGLIWLFPTLPLESQANYFISTSVFLSVKWGS